MTRGPLTDSTVRRRESVVGAESTALEVACVRLGESLAEVRHAFAVLRARATECLFDGEPTRVLRPIRHQER